MSAVIASITAMHARNYIEQTGLPYFLPVEGAFSLIEWRYASPWKCLIELSDADRVNARMLANPPAWANGPARSVPDDSRYAVQAKEKARLERRVKRSKLDPDYAVISAA